MEVDGGEWRWVHCLIMPNFFIDSVKMEVSLANNKKDEIANIANIVKLQKSLS